MPGEDLPPPPSYDEVAFEPRAIPLLVQLQHHSPGRVLDRRRVLAGPLLSTQSDAILLPTTASFPEALVLLHHRVSAHLAATPPHTTGRFFCSLVLELERHRLMLQEDNWLAARHFLRFGEHVELVCMFCIVPEKYTSRGLLQALKRKFGGSNAGGVHLVEGNAMF